MLDLKTTIAVLLIALTAILLTGVSIAALNASRNVDLNGTITTVNIEVFYDHACTESCSNINVGMLSPGSVSTYYVYIKNTGSVPVTLSMTTENWVPTAASNYLNLSWNRQDHILNAGASCEAALTLSIAANAESPTTFGFSATIIGTQ